MAPGRPARASAGARPPLNLGVRLAADENFNGHILKALRRAIPDLDLHRVQDTPLAGLADDELLATVWSPNTLGDSNSLFAWLREVAALRQAA